MVANFAHLTACDARCLSDAEGWCATRGAIGGTFCAVERDGRAVAKWTVEPRNGRTCGVTKAGDIMRSSLASEGSV